MKAREAKKEKAEGGSEMEVESTTDKESDSKMEVEGAKAEGGDAKEEDQAGESKKEIKKKEPATHTLTNPSRLTRAQQAFVEFETNQRYRPVHLGAASGIVMLLDTTPSEEEDLSEVKIPSANQADDDDEEDAEAPEPFEWTPPSN